ncbi:hypothetical protein QBC46DRAFT_414764 [Diplogelasinospora grovesii]|uniref:Uncharacterized protein n=1 Tax=Diplogelasinospora grovesii TaxID=303347 RepID=A0AAN6MU16_9PEZI|nr:hypothetical protein QBC46DRAFT_414764 [Diplogelasinospora grovesii]
MYLNLASRPAHSIPLHSLSQPRPSLSPPSLVSILVRTLVLNRPTSMYRRAWQRRGIRCDRAAASKSTTISKDEPRKPARETQRHASRVQEWPDDTSLDSESTGESDTCIPVNRRIISVTGTCKVSRRLDASDSDSSSESESDSDIDSGYGSLEEDPDERAEFYDHLLERFRSQGLRWLTMAIIRRR